MSFSLTSSGLTYTNSNNITKHIVIDDNSNTIDFQQFNISAVSVSNKEYVENSIDPHLVSYWPLTSITNGTTPDIINGYDLDVVNMDATNIRAVFWSGFGEAVNGTRDRGNRGGHRAKTPQPKSTTIWLCDSWQSVNEMVPDMLCSRATCDTTIGLHS